MNIKNSSKQNQKMNGLPVLVTQSLDYFKIKDFNPVYEDWIKRINPNDRLPRGKYLKKN